MHSNNSKLLDFNSESMYNNILHILYMYKGEIMGFWSKLMADYKIVRTIIVDTDSRKSMTSGIVRGAVGGIFGGLGSIAGIASAKNKKTTTFLVEYESGRRATKKVKTGSMEYKNLLRFLDQ